MERTPRTRTLTLSRPVILVLIAAAFALGVFTGTGLLIFSGGGADSDTGGDPRRFEDFRYIRQSLLQETPQEQHKIRELQPFRFKVNSLVAEKLADEEVRSVSVYFRDLDNGNWFGIAENDAVSPERELKLPLMIAYYKWAETNPLVLRKQLLFRPGAPAAPARYLSPPRALEPGKQYSVNDLIFRMVAYGDGDAYALLLAQLPPQRLQRVYRDLYVNYDPSRTGDAFTLSAYASFFRVLFNASYLTEEMSEKALRTLTRSAFRNGMFAGVPADIAIAGKAGERTFPDTDGDEVLQLHEFGIVYHPLRPFLLGITVRGDDFERMAKVIQDVTRLIYAEVDQQSN